MAHDYDTGWDDGVKHAQEIAREEMDGLRTELHQERLISESRRKAIDAVTQGDCQDRKRIAVLEEALRHLDAQLEVARRVIDTAGVEATFSTGDLKSITQATVDVFHGKNRFLKDLKMGDGL